jgi:hypothetical protein
MSSAREEKAGRHRVMQVIVALYSFVFFMVIAYGYFYLAIGSSFFVATVIALLAATLAWFLAKFIGQSETGIRGHIPMFVLLLLISATGVFNSAMVRLEGDRIVSETASESQDRFAALKRAAGQALAKDVSAFNDVIGLRDALVAELRNPMNCGQGGEARRILDRLERALPGFRPLSVGGAKCAKVEEAVAEYRAKIDELMKAKFPNMSLITDASESQQELRALQAQATTDYSPTVLRPTKGMLAKQNDRYRDLYARLDQLGGGVDQLPSQLDVSAVQNLGDATKLPMLFLDRLDVGSTYVYLALAVFFDWLMIYFFMQARQNKVRRPAAAPTLSGAY